MTHQDVLQICDADMRTKVYSVVPGFEGKGDRMTVQDAINYEMADRFDVGEHDCHAGPEDGCDCLFESRGSREPKEIGHDLEEKYAHEAWMAQA